MTRCFCAVIALFLSFSVHAETFYQVHGSFRHFPRAGTIEAHWNYNQKLWDSTTADKNWNYGFWRVGAHAAIHGQVGARVDVHPISFLQLSYFHNFTSRFYETLTLDCLEIACRGTLERRMVRAQMALAYGAFFLIPTYSQTFLQLDSDKRNFSSEEDNLVADRQGDRLVTQQWALGYNHGDQRWIFMARQSKMKKTEDFNRAQYLIWSRPYNPEINYFVGAGWFESSYVQRGASVITGVSWTVGENLALF